MIAEPTFPTRTAKQPLQWRCRNPVCRHEFFSDYAECPKCGGKKFPHVVLLTLIHMLLPDPSGPIQGMFTRLRLACDGQREMITDRTNNEAATGVPAVVNCPGCLAELNKLKLSSLVGAPITGGK